MRWGWVGIGSWKERIERVIESGRKTVDKGRKRKIRTKDMIMAQVKTNFN